MGAYQGEPIGRRKQIQKAETYQLILNSAQMIFKQQGFDKTTMRAVAIDAGVALGTIFNHFPSKKALLVAALFDDLEEIIQSTSDTLEENIPVEAKLMKYIEILYQYFAQKPALSKVMLKQTLFLDGEWGHLLGDQVNQFIKRIKGWIRMEQEKELIRQDIDCELAAISLFSQYIWVLAVTLREPVIDWTSALSQANKLVKQTVFCIRN